MRRWMPWCAFTLEHVDGEFWLATCPPWTYWSAASGRLMLMLGLGDTPELALADLTSQELEHAGQFGAYRSCGCLWCDFNGPRGHHPGLRSDMTHRRTIRHIRRSWRMPARSGEQR